MKETQAPWSKTIPAPALKKSYRLALVGLGDVGGTLAIGLRLLGQGTISSLGLYDPDQEKMKRYQQELGQIYGPHMGAMPTIHLLESMEEVFQQEVVIFTASKAIPPVGSKVGDVRRVQFKGNRQILAHYARAAKKVNYQGIFAVVSDPVDLLASFFVAESGLAPSQVIGFGQGVMMARARYYGQDLGLDLDSITLYGPHGKGLVVANDPLAYEDDLSLRLSQLTIEANLQVRAIGYKPFIAPALSSGAISILDLLRGQPFYGSVMLGPLHLGGYYHFVDECLALKKPPQHPDLVTRVEESYKELMSIYEEDMADYTG